jgi:AcrR family transcriptional regulator
VVSTLNKRRARSDDDKELRRQQMLATARQLWGQHTVSSFTMNELAEASGVAKGTLYLYFKTKEEVLLALLTEAFEHWFLVLRTELTASTTTMPPKSLAALLAQSLANTPHLPRLLPIAASILEHNLSREAVVQYKFFLLRHLSELSGLINTRAPYLQGNGKVLFMQVYALAVGFGQMADPAPAVTDLLALEVMASLRVQFLEGLQFALEQVLLGYASQVSGSPVEQNL